MSHSYEVLVDIREFDMLEKHRPRIMTVRYEVDADSQINAHDTARDQARLDYPQATEYDVTVTRFLI